MRKLVRRLDLQFHRFAGLDAVPGQVLRDNVWVSMSGFFMMPSFMATLDAFGIDRIIYSVDYPFGSLEHGRAVLETLPVSADDLA